MKSYMILAASTLVASTLVSLVVNGARERLQFSGETVAELLHQSERDSTTVVLVMQPADCFQDTLMLRAWRALDATAGLAVRGVVVGQADLAPQQRRLLQELAVSLQIESIDSRAAARVASAFGYLRTPFAVVLGRSGQVVASFPARERVSGRELLELASRGSGNIRPPRPERSTDLTVSGR
jgi:hypothetical protein